MKFTAELFAVAVALGLARGAKDRQLRGSSLEPGKAGIDVGSADCPCIGLHNISGEIESLIADSVVVYPTEAGSYCDAWDDGRNQDHCLEGQDPGKGNGWCARNWCWVDACNCKGIGTPPKTTQQGIAFQGKPLYYSYATCGQEDTWTADHNEKSCITADNEEECNKHNNGNCIWGKTDFGEEDRCVGWEVSGLCPGLPETSFWGRRDCPCVGFIGLNGVMLGQTESGERVNYSASVGSLCKAWDSFVHPDCMGDERPGWCNQEWCLVDPRKCAMSDTFAPPVLAGASFQGHEVHMSYETCGSKRLPTPSPPPEEVASSTPEPTTAKATTVAPASVQATTTPAPTTSAKATTADDKNKEEDKEEKEEEDEEEKEEKEDDDDDDDDDRDTVKARTVKRDHAKQARQASQRYDEDAYEADWHNEWEHGEVPSYRDMHPEVSKIFFDRQSDGVPSNVY